MCSIGLFLKVECKMDETFCTISDFDESDQLLLRLRVGCDASDLVNTCVYHKRRYLMQYASHHISCCDPLIHPSDTKLKCLRNITMALRDKFSLIVSLIPGKKLCSICRKALPKRLASYIDSVQGTKLLLSDVEHSRSSCSDPDDSFVTTSVEVDNFNKTLGLLGESPVIANKMSGKQYSKRKFRNIKSSVVKKLKLISPGTSAWQDDSSSDERKNSGDLEEMMEQLKIKFEGSNKSDDKIRILSVLPKSWSKRKIREEFHEATDYLIRKTKKLVDEQGILPTSNCKAGKTLSDATTDKIKSFYEDDEMSRMMPGTKDFVSVKVNGKREHHQKRLILSDLKHIYRSFKDKYPDAKVGFSKFAELRPKHCVLAGASGTHSVCVCTTHQNVKLMIEGAKLKSDESKSMQTYQHCLALIMCNPPHTSCFIGKCTNCPGIRPLQSMLENYFDDNFIENVHYKQWVTTDRCTMETLQKTADDFVVVFLEKLVVLRHHDFIARQQSSFLREKKETLLPGEVIVVGDFAENYSFVLQDAAQGFHWNNSQATLHPFVSYYKPLHSPLQHLNFVIISDCLTHDTVSVHTFQNHLISYLKLNIKELKLITYISDGAGSQYKNKKNFINLCCHQIDFGIPAEWHFFATSHGKGPCDGVGGSVKRLAVRTSLQRPYNDQIQTAFELFKWAEDNFRNISFKYVTHGEVEEHGKVLETRFESILSVTGTRSFHAYLPVSETSILVKTYSHETNGLLVKLKLENEEENIEDQLSLTYETLGSFATVRYDRQWWLAYVLAKSPSTEEVKVRFLHPHGPSPSFVYPNKDDELTISINEVLTSPNPSTASTGRTYKLTSRESFVASERLQALS